MEKEYVDMGLPSGTLYIQKGRRGKSCPLTTAIIKRLILRAWGKK